MVRESGAHGDSAPAVILPPAFGQRASLTGERLEGLARHLQAHDVTDQVYPGACLYATGSVGRGEAGEHSDLDIFILDNVDGRTLTNLRTILLQASLIRASGAAGFPEFSGDGEYLAVHHLDELLLLIGRRDDDYENLFTARMLLLLESRALVGADVYEQSLDRVVTSYWRDSVGNENGFLPIFLANDISRYWKTLCVNYEARDNEEFIRGGSGARSQQLNLAGESPERAKRRVNNYKLKFSRLLTCYSGLLYLAFLFRRDATVRHEAAIAMAHKTPVERCVEIAEAVPEVRDSLQLALERYAEFLEETDRPKPELEERFASNSHNRQQKDRAREFGDCIYRALRLLSDETALGRYLLV